jgi:DNA/RNA-binding domain of Phe-tRNA-synthetase-like protein
MRFALCGERFEGIGMNKPMALSGKEVVISDEEKLIAVYPYRDADKSKVAAGAKNLMILVCGVPGVDEAVLENAGKIALEFVTRFCGGDGRFS